MINAVRNSALSPQVGGAFAEFWPILLKWPQIAPLRRRFGILEKAPPTWGEMGGSDISGHMANFAGSSGNPENRDCSRARSPVGSAAKRRGLSPISADRPKLRGIAAYLVRAGRSRTSRIHGQLRMTFWGSRKCRRFADTPAFRFHGEGDRFTPNHSDGLSGCTLIST